MRVIEFRDEIEFLPQCGPEHLISTVRKASISSLPCQVFQMLLRGLARRHRLVGILGFELSKRKIDAAGKPHGFRDRPPRIPEQTDHFIRWLYNAVRIR